LAWAAAVLAASGCGGGGADTATQSSTTQASTIPTSTISVPNRVFVMNSGKQQLEEPDEFVFNADGGVVGRHLRWTDWGQPSAIGVGAFSENRFSKSNRVRFQSALGLSRLRVCNGAEYYTHASVAVPSSPIRPSVKPLPTPCG
jgi:hypothetical protein